MATLNRHKGIETIYRHPRGDTRYAVCQDGKILSRRAGFGWKLTEGITVETLAKVCEVDDSTEARAIITRANRDAHAHDQAKKTRRLLRR